MILIAFELVRQLICILVKLAIVNSRLGESEFSGF